MEKRAAKKSSAARSRVEQIARVQLYKLSLVVVQAVVVVVVDRGLVGSQLAHFSCRPAGQCLDQPLPPAYNTRAKTTKQVGRMARHSPWPVRRLAGSLAGLLAGWPADWLTAHCLSGEPA